MVDASLNVWLIEVNSNPCLELASPYLGTIIPRLLEHVMQLTVDVAFPPAAPSTGFAAPAAVASRGEGGGGCCVPARCSECDVDERSDHRGFVWLALLRQQYDLWHELLFACCVCVQEEVRMAPVAA